MKKFQELIDENLKVIEEYERHISIPVLEGCNAIVEYGVHTMGCNGDKTALKCTLYPTQFTEKTAREIIKEVSVKACDGSKVEGVFYYARDWYKKEIARRREAVEELQKFIAIGAA
jgi:hypothetical protein